MGILRDSMRRDGRSPEPPRPAPADQSAAVIDAAAPAEPLDPTAYETFAPTPDPATTQVAPPPAPAHSVDPVPAALPASVAEAQDAYGVADQATAPIASEPPPAAFASPPPAPIRPSVTPTTEAGVQRGSEPTGPPGKPAASRADGRSELRRRRDALAEQVAEMHWDLGGLAYEMAIRDHFRLDVLVRRAAALQERDAELAEIERMLRSEEDGIAGECPVCRAPHSRGAVYCWQCGATLMHVAPSAALEEEPTAVMDSLPATGDAGWEGHGGHSAG